MTHRFTTLIALCSVALLSQALERVTLGVECRLDETRYRDVLQANQIVQVQQACAQRLALILDERLGFLDFEPNNNHSDRIIIALGKSDMDIRAVEFSVWVEGSSMEEEALPVQLPFRSIDQWLEIPTFEAFPDEIQLQFASALRDNADRLVDAQLSRVVVARQATPLPDDRSWRLPFTRDELNTQDNSQFSIKAKLMMSNDSQERLLYEVKLKGDFVDGAKALHLGDDTYGLEDSLERLGRADNVEVLYVVVKRYVPLKLPTAVTPAEFLDSQRETQP